MYKRQILARQLERGEASGEFSKINAIMGEDIEETGDYIVNEKEKSVNLTEDGVKKVEKFFHIENLADPENLEIQHNIILALRAHNLMFRDQDYVVTPEGEVVIVDEFTGLSLIHISSSITSSGLASGLSILLIHTITGRFNSNALRSTNFVCGIAPSNASTTRITPFTIFNTRSTSPPKSACPGVSMILIFVPL